MIFGKRWGNEKTNAHDDSLLLMSCKIQFGGFPIEEPHEKTCPKDTQLKDIKLIGWNLSIKFFDGRLADERVDANIYYES